MEAHLQTLQEIHTWQVVHWNLRIVVVVAGRVAEMGTIVAGREAELGTLVVKHSVADSVRDTE